MKPYPLYEVELVHNLKELVDYSAEKHGDKVAFSWLHEDEIFKVSFKKLREDTRALGAFFIASGFKDEKIALIGKNSYEWILTFFATVNSGNTVVPIDKELSAKEIEALLEHSGAQILVYSDDAIDKILDFKDNSSGKTFINMRADLPDIMRNTGENHRRAFDTFLIDDDRLCTISYTSGTTGNPKGVMLSHKNLTSNTLNACRNFSMEGDSLLFLPLCHTFTMTACLLGQLYYGNTNFINDKLKNISKEMTTFCPDSLFAVPLFIENMRSRIWRQAKQQKKTKQLKLLMASSGILYTLGIDVRRKLLKNVLASFGGNLGVIICGGAPLEPEIVKEFRKLGIDIFNGYGITECSPIVSINRNHYYKDGSTGPLLNNYEVKIVEGEIFIKGDSIMLGYYNEPQATQEAFDDGWFKTGDLGHLDKDGFLYVTGRKKNVILLPNGINVSAEELEKYVKGLANVVEVMVYQVKNKITAEIFPDSTVANVKETIERDVRQLNYTLPKHKRIDQIKFRETEFEKNATKKIKRTAVG